MTQGVVKLSDFGWACHATGKKRQTICGTLDYLPPEMCDYSIQPYDKSVDIWSIGVLAYELCVGKPPFESPSHLATKKRIQIASLDFPQHLSEKARDFIAGCLQKEPDQRMSCKQIFAHPWIAQRAKDLI